MQLDEFVSQKKREGKNVLQNSPLSHTAFNGNLNSIEDENVNNVNDNPKINKDEGLNSQLNPGKTTQDAPIGESFLKQVEQQLITQINEESFLLKKEGDKTIIPLLE